MTKAEQRALEAYPVEIKQLVYQDLIDAFGGKTEADINTFQRHMFQQGYEQAEKDLHSWTEEDEDMFESVMMWLDENEPEFVEKDKAWLESIKNRLK